MSNTVSRTVSDDTLNRIIQIESAGKPLAKATTSSALGLGQFLNATWLATVKQNRPEWLKGRTRAQVLALRRNPSLSIEMLARLTEDSQRIIGMNCTPGDLYLAHFLGPSDAKDLFRAAPITPVAALVSQAVIKANRSIMQGKTAGQVRSWADRKMAKPPRENWIAKYYTGEGPDAVRPVAVMAEADTDAPDDDARGTPIEQPLPPEDVSARRRDPEPVDDSETIVTPKQAGGFFPWCKRVVKSKLGWASSAIGGISGASILGFVTDWRTITAFIGLVVVLYLIYRFGRK